MRLKGSIRLQEIAGQRNYCAAQAEGTYPEVVCGKVEILILHPKKFTLLNVHCLQKQVKCPYQTIVSYSHPGANVYRVARIKQGVTVLLASL